MILTAHQPVYLPWLGLFHKIALADLFISFDQVQYLPKDWNNRNRIKTQSGPIWLTTPVLRKGHREKTIAQLEINNDIPWGRKHWKSISMAYARAPHFHRYAAFFEDVYMRRWDTLNELNTYMLQWLLETLGIKVPVRTAGEFDFKGAKNDLVLDMCRTLGAEVYIFGALGRGYADEEAFGASGIQVLFQDYRHPVYPQLHGDFVSHLSVIDLLFNCGDESLGILLSGNLAKQEIVHPKTEGGR